jgi:hypothetical protein
MDEVPAVGESQYPYLRHHYPFSLITLITLVGVVCTSRVPTQGALIRRSQRYCGCGKRSSTGEIENGLCGSVWYQ